MGDYDARSETTQNLLNDWYEAYRGGDVASANSIRDTIVDSGLISASEFEETVVGNSYQHNGDSWLDYSSDLADDLINSQINQDIRDEIAEDGERGLWTGDGSVGKEALELENDLLKALGHREEPQSWFSGEPDRLPGGA